MTYHQRNSAEIGKLSLPMQHKVNQLIERLSFVGEDILIPPLGGKRTSNQQDGLYSQGRDKPGKIVTHVNDSNSMHTHGVAIDVVPVGPLGVPRSKRYLLEWTATYRYKKIARVARGMGFEWGYDLWGEDKPHFQYRQGLSIADFKRGKNLDLNQSIQERIDESKSMMDKASRALEHTKLESRQRRLKIFINMTERKVRRLRKQMV